MAKNVVFVGEDVECRKNLHYAMRSLKEEGAIIGPIVSEVWKQGEIDIFAALYRDEKVADILKGMTSLEDPSRRYLIARAEVANELMLEPKAWKIWMRYDNMEFRIY